jgi:hypothetical protein
MIDLNVRIATDLGERCKMIENPFFYAVSKYDPLDLPNLEAINPFLSSKLKRRGEFSAVNTYLKLVSCRISRKSYEHPNKTEKRRQIYHVDLLDFLRIHFKDKTADELKKSVPLFYEAMKRENLLQLAFENSS